MTNGGPNPGDSDTTVTPVSIAISASTPTVGTPTKARDGGGTTFFTGDRITLNAAITNVDGNNPADYTYVWSQSSGVPTSLSSTGAANPTYIIPTQTNGTSACTSGNTSATANCPEYKVTVTKTNTGKSSALSASLANYTSSLPARPVANAGTAQAVKVGATPVTLGGSGSQTQGHPISYTWSQTGGTVVALSDIHAAQPTFTAPSSPTSLTFSLTVVDTQNPIVGSGASGNTSTASATSVTVTTYDAPVVDAGSDQTLHAGGGTVTLQGSASQTDNHNLSYSWVQTSGAPVTLSDATALQPTFTAPTNGPDDLGFSLTVVDTQNVDPAMNTRSASVVVHVTNVAPVADAGTDVEVLVDSPVTLDGSASTDADADTLTYSWVQQSGTAVTLADANTASPSFTSPGTVGTLVFELTVDDGHGLTSTATVHIGIGVVPPVADAGTDQSGITPGTTVTLNGTGSSDANPGGVLTYSWTQTSGPSVTLATPHASTTTFTAPTGPAPLVFQLDVSDQYGAENSASVTINVTGTPGLDFSATSLVGKVHGQLASDTFSLHVKNAGTITRTISNADLQKTVTVNGVPVNPSALVVTAKSVKLAHGYSTIFTLKWNHGVSSLHAGDAIVVTACIDLFGDFTPANNCRTVLQPTGTTTLTIHAASYWGGFNHTRTSDPLTAKVVNVGTATVTPLRNSDVTLTISVNGNTPQVIATNAKSVTLLPGGMTSITGKWVHSLLHIGDSVDVQACLNVPGNTGTPCNDTVYIVH